MVAVVDLHRLGDQATSVRTGTVNEPSVDSSGLRFLVTGNWFASRTTDGGGSWTPIDPSTAFPSAAGGFCCDQLVRYSRTARRWIWYLQYIRRADGSNVGRVAVSATGAPGTWTWWDLSPSLADSTWAGLWLDYPDMAESDEHLYLTSNLFDASDRWRGAAVLRARLDALVGREPVVPELWSTTEVGSLRLTEGETGTIAFAGHDRARSGLHVFTWADDEPQPRAAHVPVSPWRGSGYTSRGPDGTEWLARIDGRITGAWRVDDALGFAWTAAADGSHPHPHVRVVRVDATTMTVVDEPHLWSPNGAWAYPACSPNQRGDVGITAFYGGPVHPAHAVGWLSPDGWEVTLAGDPSTHGPSQGKWGDYLSIRPDPRRTTYWIAAGFVLRGGQDRRNIDPQVVVFRP